MSSVQRAINTHALEELVLQHSAVNAARMKLKERQHRNSPFLFSNGKILPVITAQTLSLECCSSQSLPPHPRFFKRVENATAFGL